MKKAIGIIILGLLWCSNVFAESLQLICSGIGTGVSTSSVYDPTTGKTIGINSRKSTKASVTVSIDEKENWIQLPNILLPPVKKKKPGNKYDLYNLEITDKEISGKFKINIINKPSMTIDRYTGVMAMKGFGTTFDGQCEKVDLMEKKF